MQAILAFPANTGPRGFIRVFKEDDSTVFVAAAITNVVDMGAYITVTVDNATLTANSGFVITDSLVASFVSSGDDGNPGAPGFDGVNGTTIVHNDTSYPCSLSIAWTTLSTYAMPANTLSDDGDGLEISFWVNIPISIDAKCAFRIMINGNWYISTLGIFTDYSVPWSLKQGKVEMKVARVNNTTIAVSSQYTPIGRQGATYPVQGYAWAENPASAGVLDLAGAICDIDFDVRSNGADSICGSVIEVKLLKI